MKFHKFILDWLIPLILCVLAASCMTTPAKAVLSQVYKVSLSQKEAVASQNYISVGD